MLAVRATLPRGWRSRDRTMNFAWGATSAISCSDGWCTGPMPQLACRPSWRSLHGAVAAIRARRRTARPVSHTSISPTPAAPLLVVHQTSRCTRVTGSGVEQQRPIVEVIVKSGREARRYPCCPIAAVSHEDSYSWIAAGFRPPVSTLVGGWVATVGLPSSAARSALRAACGDGGAGAVAEVTVRSAPEGLSFVSPPTRARNRWPSPGGGRGNNQDDL